MYFDILKQYCTNLSLTRPLTRANARVISINILSANMYQNSLVEWK